MFFLRQHLPSLWIVIYEVLSVSWMKNINLSVVGVSLELQCWQIIIDKCQRSLCPVQHKAWTEFMIFRPHFDESTVMIILSIVFHDFLASYFETVMMILYRAVVYLWLHKYPKALLILSYFVSKLLLEAFYIMHLFFFASKYPKAL